MELIIFEDLNCYNIISYDKKIGILLIIDKIMKFNEFWDI